MVTGRLEVLQGPGVEYSVFPIMVLQRDDKHSMQLDSKYIPQAIVNNRLGSAFHVPIGMNTAYDTSSIIPLALCLTDLFQLLSASRWGKAPSYFSRPSQSDYLS